MTIKTELNYWNTECPTKHLLIYFFWSRYSSYFKPEDENFGVYQIIEDLFVRHYTVHGMFNLLKKFDILWMEQLSDVKMNGNPVRTCHLIARKSPLNV